MNRYLLDTNHLSAYLDRHASLEERIDAGLRAGDRFGICLPVLCEYRAGIRLSRRYQRNLARLQAAQSVFRSWPADESTAVVFAEIFQQLRSIGKMLSPFDMLIAAIARQHALVLLSADKDFRPVKGLRTKNWL